MNLKSWGVLTAIVGGSAAAFVGAAQAAPTTWSVTGIVDSDFVNGVPIGQSASMTISLDLSALATKTHDTDGATFNTMYGNFYNAQQTNPLQVSGQYSNILSTGGGSSSDFGQIYVLRSKEQDGYNIFQLTAQSMDSDGSMRGLTFSIFDYLGPNTEIFNDLSGVNLLQGINWYARNATTYFQAFEYVAEADSVLVNQEGHLALLAIPEPASLALVGLALITSAGAGARGRNRG